MIYRVDEFIENGINPITGKEYDISWRVLILSDSTKYHYLCGAKNGCAYTVKISRLKCTDWKLSVNDFIGFNESIGNNIILVMSEEEYLLARKERSRYRYNDFFLRGNEPEVLIHSTSLKNWNKIRSDGMLKSWNRLKAENVFFENQPIGTILGDPLDFSDYIMFGGGVTGEIVVNSKQTGRIVMDINKEYLTGARLYFDARKMATDGLIIRDGCHLKVKDILPLKPYLLWTVDWKTIGLNSPISTPKIFSELSDKEFSKKFDKFNLSK